jgi:uracil-DNA glycosylase
MPLFETAQELTSEIVRCKQCPRLVAFRENVPEKKQYAEQTYTERDSKMGRCQGDALNLSQAKPALKQINLKSLSMQAGLKCSGCSTSAEPIFESRAVYWKKPVPGFGDPNAYLLILGLAPSAQGGNRTGRIFTGDESARFLFQALHQEGFASQPTSENLHDGLALKDCYLTAAVKCAPPKDKPTALEQKHCLPYLANEFYLLKKLTKVLVLGGFAFDAYLKYIKGRGGPLYSAKFRHAEKYSCEGLPDLYTSYHPSPQNTNTGRLTQAMLCAVLKQIRMDYTQGDPKTGL